MTPESQIEDAIETLSHSPAKREGFLAFAAIGAIVAYGACMSLADSRKRQEGRGR